ncbi:MAG: pyridoxal phosphate-dependent aminotransferase [Propionibacteriaceae bacterium]|nr:pyridoxal phosphate-dependent aminotransferase [Propionibacteriaceae bacterium]
MLSDRFAHPAPPNAWSTTRAELVERGVALTDLTDSNPTRHGLFDPALLEILARATRDAVRYDPDPRGPLPARETLSARYGGSPDEYWLTTSTSQAYAWLFTLLADPGDEVAIPAPGYPLIEPLAGLTGLGVARYRLHYLHPYGWSIDRDDVAAAAARARMRAIIVVHPGNPTGSYVSADDHAALIDTCARGGIPLVSDEVFRPFTVDLPSGSPPSLAGAPGIVTITLDGLSKTLCAPGLKLAWIHLTGPHSATAPLAAALDEIADAFLPVAAPTAAALPALLEAADGIIARTRERLIANRSALETIFPSPLRIRRCDGGWTALLDLPATTPDPTITLLEEHHLSIHPGWFYDLPTTNTLALSLLPEEDTFRESCERLRTALTPIIHL